jgi:quinol monooxygenase YgiN
VTSLAYVVAATYRARENEDEKIREILEIMAPLSRAEPGCLFYQAHRSPEDPRVFFLYEQYTDEAAYEARKATPHFQEHVFGYILEYLEERSVKTYSTIDV